MRFPEDSTAPDTDRSRPREASAADPAWHRRGSLTLCKGTVIAYNTVRRPVFAKAHIQLRDAGDGFCKISLQTVQISRFSQRGELIHLVAHIVPCLPGFLDGGFQAFVALLLHGKKLVLLLQSRVPVDADRHKKEDRVKEEHQKQKRDAHNDVDLQDPPGLKRRRVTRDHEKVQQNEHKRQHPERIPCLRKLSSSTIMRTAWVAG